MVEPLETGSGPKPSHESVLLAEVLDALGPLDGARVVDGTFGAGGYSRALLEAGASVVGIDRDPGVMPYADALADVFPDRFTFIAGRFAELDTLVAGLGGDAVVLDIGVSSMQLDQGARGFSFQKPGPLDMRMSQQGTSASDLVNGLEEKQLANLIFAYGEERAARRIAKAIIAAREQAEITDTLTLAHVIEQIVGRKPGGPHPATRTFQALRIAVNREFDELVEGLFAAERMLPQGGRLAVVTFHSLEDRIVKRFLDVEKTAGSQSRHMPVVSRAEPVWAPIRKPVRAGAAELARNPRARSATLRSAVRTAAPARPASTERLGVPGFAGDAA